MSQNIDYFVDILRPKKLKEKNANRLFEYLFIEPLLKIDYNKPNPIILVIDALDEAGGIEAT